MRELPTDLLIEYVDEQTPEEAPPFEFVEQAVRRQRRTRSLVAAAAVVLVAGGAVFAAAGLPRAEEPAAPPTVSTPTVGLLDDGPPPAQFKFGTTLLLLQGEIPVTAVRADPQNSSGLIVEAARESDESCLPQTMVRILSQDAATVRVAAYRYAVAPDQPEGQQCPKPGATPLRIPLDLRRELGTRTVLAGSTGHRVILN